MRKLRLDSALFSILPCSIAALETVVAIMSNRRDSTFQFFDYGVPTQFSDLEVRGGSLYATTHEITDLNSPMI